MTDQKKLQRLLDAACRAGDAQIDAIVAKSNELRQLRREAWRALIQLRAGRADAARQTLQRALKQEGEA
jgi:hypothetical protein